MSIERNTKNTLQHEESFTVLLNDVLNGIKHTGALGVYCYLASKQSGWEICKKHLQNHFNCGRDHIDTCFSYLKKVGALQIVAERNEKGEITEWKTILKRKLSPQPEANSSFQMPINPSQIEDLNQNTENPYSSEIHQNTRIRETHNVGNPQCGKPAPINKRNIKKESKEKDNKRSIVDFKKSTSHVDDELFMTFYSVYPNKQKPAVAHKAFKKLSPNAEFVRMLIEDLKARIKNNWFGRDKDKIPHPATYLNSREWEGDIIPFSRSSVKMVNNSRQNDHCMEWTKLGIL